VSEECSSIFVQEMDWIKYDPSEAMGKIQCPKCNEKIGKYYLYGAQCSCGRWVAPGFQIHKSK
jgi:dual specificity phosphatase 12